MGWVMLFVVNLMLYQVPFETRTLCERAKAKLVEDNGIKQYAIACVQVKEDHH